MIEFCLLVPVWLPLLVGTFLYGSAMIREQELCQMARELGSMYSRGVDFSSSAYGATALKEITQGAGKVTAGGNGAVIFSTVEFLGPYECGSVDGLSNGGACSGSNYLQFVFTQQYKVPAGSSAVSKFGTPTGVPNASNVLTDYQTNAGDIATGWNNLIPAPTIGGNNGYQPGQPIYIVETFFTGSGVGGYAGGGGSYAYAVF